jgi:hypothetical protein
MRRGLDGLVELLQPVADCSFVLSQELVEKCELFDKAPTDCKLGGGGPHMRDRRFVAVHRGGPLDVAKHHLLAAWAADCAEHVLPFFKECSSDVRPQRAVEIANAWARGEVSVGDAQKAAVAAHDAARDVMSKSGSAAARAAGHAVATAHMADHCLGASTYALRAVEATGGSADVERAWQVEQLPDEVRELIISALGSRLTGRCT